MAGPPSTTLLVRDMAKDKDKEKEDKERELSFSLPPFLNFFGLSFIKNEKGLVNLTSFISAF